jgi:hypothetical protein
MCWDDIYSKALDMPKDGAKKLNGYNRDDIKLWISFGVENGYINPYKKEQVLRWVQLLLKKGIVLIR